MADERTTPEAIPTQDELHRAYVTGQPVPSNGKRIYKLATFASRIGAMVVAVWYDDGTMREYTYSPGETTPTE